jgi:hypothetical protein
MRKLLLVATGAGIGYVLGARAGRPAYDRIVETARSLGDGLRLDRTQRATRGVMAEAKQAGEQLRDKADSRIAETVEAVGSALPTDTGADDVVTLPDTSVGAETRASDMSNGF